jgi:hypothetical protein
MRDGQGGGGHALGHTEDQDQGVLTPRQSTVAQAAPQVHDRLAVPVHRASGAQLATLGEVVHKRLLDRLEPWGHPPMELVAGHGLGSPAHGRPFTCGSPWLDIRSVDAVLSMDANLA